MKEKTILRMMCDITGISDPHLADHFCKNKSTVRKYLSGHRNPPASMYSYVTSRHQQMIGDSLKGTIPKYSDYLDNQMYNCALLYWALKRKPADLNLAYKAMLWSQDP